MSSQLIFIWIMTFYEIRLKITFGNKCFFFLTHHKDELISAIKIFYWYNKGQQKKRGENREKKENRCLFCYKKLSEQIMKHAYKHWQHNGKSRWLVSHFVSLELSTLNLFVIHLHCKVFFIFWNSNFPFKYVQPCVKKS